ncbi:DeoR/GlpR family DNA-binding transcription regulator [Aerococcus tenax]|uniref:DeoR/GlpR family DNA-binding transcription regulator n=1 Tax=Aerococcus tenax TaxID=3078812 RepID=UPI0018A718D7|nr:DeoR/GlpR family DNA-binding transcription regulator [Aerococcus tenax]
MLKSERQELILNRIDTEGSVQVSDLTKVANVTEDTIRKDLQELSKKGLVKRVHGGALKVDASIVPFEERIDHMSNEKIKLGEKAINLILNKNVIFIDGGTTNLIFAKTIPNDYKGKVITNSPSIALALSNHPFIEISMLPGQLDKQSKVLKGTTTVNYLDDIFIELCILGVSSFDFNYGITVPSLEESIIKKKLIEQSEQVVAIVTKEKFNTVATYKVDNIGCISYMITDRIFSENEKDIFSKNKIIVIDK